MEENITSQKLIYDFMVRTSRPASELDAFVKAFNESLQPAAAAPQPKRKKPQEPNKVIHNGNTVNKHPRAKMVMVQFGERKDYYGSITACAQALGVSQPVVSRALMQKKTIQGMTLKKVNQEEIFKSEEIL